MNSGEMLAVRDLAVSYDGHNVVRQVSFDAHPGEIYGLLGPSGAGKSTVLAALTGTLAAEGTIQYGSMEISALRSRQRQFGHVYQDFRLFDWMSVWDNVAFPCKALGWSSADAKYGVADTLERVGLTMAPNRLVRDLSGGERQRVALARALVFRPRVLLLDEPFSHLDPPLREELKRDLVRSLASAKIPVILVTHDHDEAFELCDRVGIMIDGAIVQEGRPNDLLSEPVNLDVARLLGFSNSLEGRVRKVESDRVEVEVPGMDGCLSGRPCPGSVTVGDRVELACRPERVRIHPDHSAVINKLDSQILSVHALSDITHITLSVAHSAQWSVRCSGYVRIGDGTEAIVSIPPDDLMVYPVPRA